jgi:hypothetical protein
MQISAVQIKGKISVWHATARGNFRMQPHKRSVVNLMMISGKPVRENDRGPMFA